MLNIDKNKFIIALANTAITIEEFAEISNVSRTVISKIINGKNTNVRANTVGKIALALGMKVEELISK